MYYETCNHIFYPSCLITKMNNMLEGMWHCQWCILNVAAGSSVATAKWYVLVFCIKEYICTCAHTKIMTKLLGNRMSKAIFSRKSDSRQIWFPLKQSIAPQEAHVVFYCLYGPSFQNSSCTPLCIPISL